MEIKEKVESGDKRVDWMCKLKEKCYKVRDSESNKVKEIGETFRKRKRSNNFGMSLKEKQYLLQDVGSNECYWK